jgi:hypothetical protein
LAKQKGVFSKVVEGLQTFGYDFGGVMKMFVIEFADMCTNKLLKVYGAQTRDSSVRRPGNEDPHRRQRKYVFFQIFHKFSDSVWM